MKKNLFLITTSFFSLLFFTACKKENTNEIKNVTLNVSINAGETYQLDLSKYGDADDLATITRQAINFSTSEIVKVGTIGEYDFMKAGNPKVGGNGNETVVLKISEAQKANSGEQHSGECHAEETNITINFTIL